jgi:hypothetical protein
MHAQATSNPPSFFYLLMHSIAPFSFRLLKEGINNSYFIFTKPLCAQNKQNSDIKKQRRDDVARQDQKSIFWSTSKGEAANQINRQEKKCFFKVSS